MAENEGGNPPATPRVFTEGEMAALQASLREIEAKASGIRLDRDKHKADAAKLAADMEAATAAHTAALTRAEQRAVKADIRAALVAAGVVDPDAIAFVDLAAVKLNAAGDVENAADLVATLKEAKAYLFQPAATQPRSTGNPQPPPKPAEPAAKDARKMTPEEYAAFKAETLKRR